MHKCCNDNCPHRLNALAKLNPAEKLLQKIKSSQFKLCYIYREYLFQAAELVHPGPNKPLVDINRIHNSQNILGLILSFYVSFAISARKTAYIMQKVFNINVSYQTVLNYAESAAYTAIASTCDLKAPWTILPPEMKPISKSSANGPTFGYSYRQRTWCSQPITSRTPVKLCLPSSQ